MFRASDTWRQFREGHHAGTPCSRMDTYDQDERSVLYPKENDIPTGMRCLSLSLSLSSIAGEYIGMFAREFLQRSAFRCPYLFPRNIIGGCGQVSFSLENDKRMPANAGLSKRLASSCFVLRPRKHKH